MDVPEGLQWLRDEPGGAAWLDALPRVVDACAEHWALRVGAAFPDAYVSLVLDVRTRDGVQAVLKVQWPHAEADHEAEALGRWDGEGAVRLLGHDPDRHALLLERCVPGTHLAEAGPEAALDVFVDLLPRLWRPAGEPFVPLADEAHRWADDLPARWERAGRPFERSLVDAAIEVLRDLAGTQAEPVLLHQDLHADNVLAAEREPWLAIDPKPLAGERAFAVAPIVRAYELGHGRAEVRRRLDRLTADLGIDRERALGWTLGQTVAWAFAGDRALPRHVETARWLAEALRRR